MKQTEKYIAKVIDQIIVQDGGGCYVQTPHGYQEGFFVSLKKQSPCITARVNSCNQAFLVYKEEINEVKR